MNETWLEDFRALAEELNFSRAAERRNITQPAFGRRIRALEDWCGQPLVDRSSHRLALTPAGEVVEEAAGDLLRRIARLRRDLRELETGTGTLTVAATQALSFSFFPGWFAQAGEGVAVHLLADNMLACERLMEEGRAQFLLCHIHPQMPLALPAARYRSLALAADRLVPVSVPGPGGGARFAPAAGAELPFLAFDERSGLGRILASGLAERLGGAGLRPVFTSHLAMALRTMALEGRGLAWLPLSLVEADIAAGRLVLAGAEDWQLDVAIVLIRPRARLAPLAEAFWRRIAP
ncbi:LysR family transcriptional regulator [Poseidonocella sp. HB161398]|uniref:LysR family transcriptional regulator n=1 Tax=Poseidonocella sp. HB161398 TaxID=2320855 RepID=UPI001109EDD7|nr:LysR substrate-binding domain-containing protein [Poseidonocella sp. HB161398]